MDTDLKVDHKQRRARVGQMVVVGVDEKAGSRMVA